MSLTNRRKEIDENWERVLKPVMILHCKTSFVKVVNKIVHIPIIYQFEKFTELTLSMQLFLSSLKIHTF